MLTKEILCAYDPFGVKVQYQGITNAKELSEHNKKEPNGWDIPDGYYTKWLANAPEEVIGTKYSNIKEIKFYKDYTRIYVGKKHGYLKPLFLDEIKLCLRPLSSLTKPITHNGETFVPMDYNAFREDKEYLIEFQNGFAHHKSVKYGIIQRLLEWHFDIFGLIESGHAVKINYIT